MIFWFNDERNKKRNIRLSEIVTFNWNIYSIRNKLTLFQSEIDILQINGQNSAYKLTKNANFVKSYLRLAILANLHSIWSLFLQDAFQYALKLHPNYLDQFCRKLTTKRYRKLDGYFRELTCPDRD
jgi:hypothetical protein